MCPLQTGVVRLSLFTTHHLGEKEEERETGMSRYCDVQTKIERDKLKLIFFLSKKKHSPSCVICFVRLKIITKKVANFNGI